MSKKLPKTKYRNYISFIRDKCDELCQICSRKGQDVAHKDRGYKRDDRFIAILCRECHQIADQPTPKQTAQSKAINEQLEWVCVNNWNDYEQISK